MADWAPFATRRPGPAWKVGYSHVGEESPKRGDTKHSAEGWRAGLYSELDGPNPKSWQFTVGLDWLEQHYPFRANCYHAGDADDDGGVAANIDLVGIEHIGKAGTPLNDYQVAATVKITRWCAEQEGLRRFALYPQQEGVWTLVEHNQVSDRYTACPSGRIPWAAITNALYAEEDDMAELVQERGKRFIWVVAGNWKRYLHKMADADELGISRKVKKVAAGTLNSLGRADQGRW